MSKRPGESIYPKMKKKYIPKLPNTGKSEVKNESSPVSSNSVASASVSMIATLPVEVLFIVFEYLPLQEKDTVSLVCRHWHEVRVQKRHREKLVFCGYEKYELIISQLSSTRREILNLEFYDCSFEDSSNLLSISEKIKSLTFTHCKLSDEFLTRLFVKCNHLKEINIFPRDRHYNYGFLERLQVEQFINENVEILRLNIDGDYLSEELLDSLLRMFPNIINLPFLELSRRTDYVFGLKDSYSSFLTQKIISKKQTLEMLDIFGYESHMRQLESYNFPRLKKLSFLFRLEIIPDLTYFNLVIQLERLEALTIYVYGIVKDESSEAVPSDYIFNSITRCTHLKYLELIADVGVVKLFFTFEKFVQLFSSRLISFRMTGKFELVISDFDKFDNLYENKTLKILSFQNFVPSSVVCKLVSLFKNLNCLELRYSFETNLQSISQSQNDLRSLTFHSGNTYSNEDRHQAQRSIKFLHQFSRLEHLDFSLKDHFILFQCDVIPPKVKRLHLCLATSSEFQSELLQLTLLPLQQLEELEALHFTSVTAELMDLNTWLTICSCLKKLKLLCLQTNDRTSWISKNDENPFCDAHTKLMKSCPTLRCLVLRVGNKITFYFLDLTDGKMKVKRKVDPTLTDNFSFTEVMISSKIKLNFS